MSEPSAAQLEQLFAATFTERWNTVLVGGGCEPLYLPADENHSQHRVIYRDDFFASALHETAHWCIAGAQRRLQVDFGYWYQPDGRTPEQQRAFEQVEIKPQALEWLFTTAVGKTFRLSVDNLSSGGPEGPSVEFVRAVKKQAQAWCLDVSLPPRGRLFVAALSAHYGRSDALSPARYQRLVR